MSSVETIAKAAESDKPSSEVAELTSSRAKDLYQQANALYMEEKYALAYILYKLAWDLRHHYKIAANLGSCEYALGKYQDAAEHLAFSLRELPRDAPAEERAYFTERQSSAAKHVATLNVYISDAGTADVFVDEKYFGKAPLNGPIYVNPGAHTVRAQNKIASGHEQVILKKGESRTISLRVLPPPEPPPPPVEPSSTPGVILGIGGGLAITLLTLGATFSAVKHVNPGFTSATTSGNSTAVALTSGSMFAGGTVAVMTAAAVFTTSRWTSSPIRVAPRVGITRSTLQLGIETTF